MLAPSCAVALSGIGQWREEYQTIRPHSGLGGLTPEEFRIKEAENFQEPVVL
ncbi:MAG: transposase [Chlorobaculum sp.]|nr:transposase [Chlorobaculum sp.]